LRLRSQLEGAEDRALAPWALRSSHSKGRLYSAPEHGYRTAFQRDRDRVVHSTAFRRLQYKTQVFVYHEGDHFRNRLTHTLEAAQIARTLARTLGANEDLTEAIVLAHDLGHTPFGHSGERALHRLMREHGGFEHNRQSLRIVDLLELRSRRYRGLNLTHETRAGICKHGTDAVRYPHPVTLPELDAQPSVEAQIGDVTDEIAYHAHDIDDGLRSGLLEWDAMRGLPIWERATERLPREERPLRTDLRPRMIVALIDLLATDLMETTSRRLQESAVETPEEARALNQRVVGFSADLAKQVRELATFLRENLYQHYQVVRMAAKAERILGDLWQAYRSDPRQLPPSVLERDSDEPFERSLADYLACMTDRFAMDEHRKLFDPHTSV
jgi:dGTPase